MRLIDSHAHLQADAFAGGQTENPLMLVASATWELSAEEMARLDEASAVPEPYPYWHQQTWAGARNPRVPAKRA